MLQLFLRDLPLQAGFTVIDEASTPALSRLHKPRRALGMFSLLLVDGKKKSGFCTGVPDILCRES